MLVPCSKCGNGYSNEMRACPICGSAFILPEELELRAGVLKEHAQTLLDNLPRNECIDELISRFDIDRSEGERAIAAVRAGERTESRNQGFYLIGIGGLIVIGLSFTSLLATGVTGRVTVTVPVLFVFGGLLILAGLLKAITGLSTK